MRSKKKVLRSLGVLCLFLTMACPVSAQHPSFNVRSIWEEAQAGWHQVVDGPKGAVNLDIDIWVPDVASLPVLEVEHIQKVYPEVRDLFPEYLKHGYDAHPSQIALDRNSPYQIKHPDNVSVDITYLDVSQMDWDAPFIEENPTTLREAVTLVKDSLSVYSFDVEDFDWEHPVGVEALRWRKGSVAKGIFKGEAFTEKGFCSFSIHQKFYGIPCLADVTRVFVHYAPEGGRPRPYEVGAVPQLGAAVEDQNAYGIGGKLVAVTGIISPDMPLCAVDAVKQAVLPRIQSGNIREIYSMQLGYVLYKTSYEVDDTMWLVPTWVVGCEYYPNPKLPTHEADPTLPRNQSSFARNLLINAQTGELIDPDSKAKDRVLAPKIRQ